MRVLRVTSTTLRSSLGTDRLLDRCLSHQGLQQVGREIELPDLIGPLGQTDKGLGDELAGLHAGGGEGLDDAWIEPCERLGHGPQAMRLGLGGGARVLGTDAYEFRTPTLDHHISLHVYLAQLVLLSSNGVP